MIFIYSTQHPLFELAVASYFHAMLGRANGEIGNNNSHPTAAIRFLSWRWRYRLRLHILSAVYYWWLCCMISNHIFYLFPINLKRYIGGGSVDSITIMLKGAIISHVDHTYINIAATNHCTQIKDECPLVLQLVSSISERDESVIKTFNLRTLRHKNTHHFT